MDTVVSESGVTLDARLLRQDVIILTLEVTDNLAEGSLIIDLIAKAWCVDDGQ